MYATAEASKSACPSPDDYLRAFEGAKNIFLVTITGTLSGSHNSAQLAKNIYLEEHPDTKIHIIDSLSAGGEVDLLVEKVNDLIDQGLSFEEVVEAITAYQEKTKLLFVLAKVDNLVKNGRLSKLIGTVVAFSISVWSEKASETGTLELLQKARGPKKSVQAAYDEIIKAGYAGGRIVMAQRNNEKCCQQLSDRIRETFPSANHHLLHKNCRDQMLGEFLISACGEGFHVFGLKAVGNISRLLRWAMTIRPPAYPALMISS